jgi:hypothetical protein
LLSASCCADSRSGPCAPNQRTARGGRALPITTDQRVGYGDEKVAAGLVHARRGSSTNCKPDSDMESTMFDRILPL